MFSIITTLMLFSSIFFFFLNNPLSMGLALIFQTLLLSFFLGSMVKSFWFMYMLILIYVGGMLVLFIYVTSIFPNNKFYFNQKFMMMMFYLMLSLMLSFMVLNYFFNINFMLSEFSSNFMNDNLTTNLFSMKMLTYKNNLVLIFLVLYLFYCMLVVIKITSFMNGPLRKL